MLEKAAHDPVPVPAQDRRARRREATKTEILDAGVGAHPRAGPGRALASGPGGPGRDAGAVALPVLPVEARHLRRPVRAGREPGPRDCAHRRCDRRERAPVAQLAHGLIKDRVARAFTSLGTSGGIKGADDPDCGGISSLLSSFAMSPLPFAPRGAALDLGGSLLWRLRSAFGCRASSGPTPRPIS